MLKEGNTTPHIFSSNFMVLKVDGIVVVTLPDSAFSHVGLG
jgi:hypothetical protein